MVHVIHPENSNRFFWFMQEKYLEPSQCPECGKISSLQVFEKSMEVKGSTILRKVFFFCPLCKVIMDHVGTTGIHGITIQEFLEDPGIPYKAEIWTLAQFHSRAQWTGSEFFLDELRPRYQEICELFNASAKYVRNMTDLSYVEILNTVFSRRLEIASKHLRPYCFSFKRFIEDFNKWTEFKNKHYDVPNPWSSEFQQKMRLAAPESIRKTIGLYMIVHAETVKKGYAPGKRNEIHDAILQSTYVMSNSFQHTNGIDSLIKYTNYFGRRFKVSKKLAIALLNTDVPKNYEPWIKLPFPVIQLELPGYYSAEFKSADHNFDNRHTVVFAEQSPMGNLRLSIGSRLGACYGSLDLEDMMKLSSDNGSFLQKLLNLSVNVILYINSTKPDIIKIPAFIKQNPSTERQKEKQRRVPKDDYFILGKNITIMHQRESQENSEGSKNFTSYSYQFQVRGHWRQQPCGPNRQDRKNIWIEPHWKGPDFAAIINKDYQVK